MQNRIEAYEISQELGTPIVPLNIWNAIEFCAIAWKGVQSETIQNCWKKTKIIPSSSQHNCILETVQDEFEEESSQLERLIDKLPFDDPIMAIDYVKIDNEVVPEETVMEDEEIIAAVTLTSDNGNQEEEEIETPVVTLTEAFLNFVTYPQSKFLVSVLLEVAFYYIKVHWHVNVV